MTVDGFQILRKKEGSSAFTVIDTVTADTIIYSDSELLPLTKYYYCIIAFYGVDFSDTSNIDSATTLERYIPPPVFRVPGFSISWDTTTKKTTISIHDYSDCEMGYSIYRGTRDEPGLLLQKRINSLYPQDTGRILWSDSLVSTNNLYYYQVFALGTTETLATHIDSIYTLYEPTFFDPLPDKEIVLTDSLGSCPISYWVWAIKKGDSIILPENSAPDSTASIIDVSDKRHPVFKGYIHDESNRNFLHIVFDDVIIGGCSSPDDSTPNILTLYRFRNNALENIFQSKQLILYGYDSYSIQLSKNMILNDSTFIAICYYCDEPTNLCYKDEARLVPVIVHSGSFEFDTIRKVPLSYINDPKDIGQAFNQRLGFQRSGLDDRYHNVSNYMLIDYSHDQPIVTRPTSNPIIPKILSGLIANDPRLTQSRQQIIDTSDKIVYLLYDNRLTIFAYDISSIGIQSEIHSNNQSSLDLYAFPNPFNPFVVIMYSSRNPHPDITIYDIHGRLIEQFKGLRDNRIIWNALGHPSGVYLIRLTDGSKQTTRKVVLQK